MISKKELSSLKRTIDNGRRKVCVNFSTDTKRINTLKRMISRKKIHAKKEQYIVVGENYVCTSSWLLSCTVTETIYTTKLVKSIWTWQKTRSSKQNDYICWVTLTYFSSYAIYWMKQLFIFETFFIRNVCSLSIDGLDNLFVLSIFRYHWGVKFSFEHNSAHRNLFLMACRRWDARHSLREMDQNFVFSGAIGYGDLNLAFFLLLQNF